MNAESRWAASAFVGLLLWPRGQRRQTERLPHGRKRPAMRRAGAERLQGHNVRPHRITLVLRKSVVRMLPVEIPHHGIPSRLRED